MKRAPRKFWSGLRESDISDAWRRVRIFVREEITRHRDGIGDGPTSVAIATVDLEHKLSVLEARVRELETKKEGKLR